MREAVLPHLPHPQGTTRSPARDPREEALGRLERDGLIRREEGVLRTTHRWQGAMARAALRLYQVENARDDDLRIPIASALLELYGSAEGRERLADLVGAMLPIEAAELAPRPR